MCDVCAAVFLLFSARNGWEHETLAASPRQYILFRMHIPAGVQFLLRECGFGNWTICEILHNVIGIYTLRITSALHVLLDVKALLRLRSHERDNYSLGFAQKDRKAVMSTGRVFK
jgi:hypothetical protein